MSQICDPAQPGSASRRVVAAALALVPAAIGVLTAGAALVPGSVPVSPAVLGAGAALAALALAYAIHILYLAADLSCPDRAAVARAVNRVALPILASALITAVLSLSLRFHSSAECRQVALFAAAGVAAAALAAVFLLTRFLPLSAGREHRPLALTAFGRRLLEGHAGHRRHVAVVLAACTLLAAVGLPRLRLETGPTTVSGTAAEARGGWRNLESALRRAVQDRESPNRFLRRAADLAPTRLTRDGVIRFGTVAAVVAGALLWLLFGRLTLVGITMLPVGAVVLWTLGALGLAAW